MIKDRLTKNFNKKVGEIANRKMKIYIIHLAMT